MAPSLVHLPNGQTLTVQPVFGGLFFKANELNSHRSIFPAGWTIILNCEDDEDDHIAAHPSSAAHTQSPPPEQKPNPMKLLPNDLSQQRPHHVHRFRTPSLRNDHMFISSISNPSSSEFKPASSPTRQIAMMLWASLWWYFHQPEPPPYLNTPASAKTPDAGKPKGEWRVNINREGIFKGKHLLPKLERMGLIASEDSCVGLDPEDGVSNAGEGWTKMFVSRRNFWQLDARIYLFTLSPAQGNSPFPSVSPASSRPASPSRNAQQGTLAMSRATSDEDRPGLGPSAISTPPPLLSRHNTPPGPFTSSSHLPTYYPPPPLQYVFTNNIRHPVRPKPPRQGETFYTRYIPSLGQYLSFRVASLSKYPVIPRGPSSNTPGTSDVRLPRPPVCSERSVPTLAAMSLNAAASTGVNNTDHGDDTEFMTDTELLHKWMNDPRVAYSWGEDGPISHQRAFLSTCLTSKHSFPAIGCFDGKPFGFFEIYWVKEDRMSAHLAGAGPGGGVGEWDRGLHMLVGEQEFRGPHRIKVWLSALVHHCWLADNRTMSVVMEPRVDNTKYVKSVTSTMLLY